MNISWKNFGLGATVLLLITFATYIPAINSGYIWDDNDYVTENTNLRTLEGLQKIWLETGSEPQYYPMTHTSFWLEYHLWGLNPFGYHVVNVLLHALNAILLWALLRYLHVPGALLGAAVFALHPVHVESVGWITERKNVLSGFFYLSSMLIYLYFSRLDLTSSKKPLSSSIKPIEKSDAYGPWGLYTISLMLYILALLSKTVTCTMPAAILLLLWWKRGRIKKEDIFLLMPFFLFGILSGLSTAWLEKYQVGAEGERWALSFVDKSLVSGRAFWFYIFKLLWPQSLTFIYPRWNIDPACWRQYLFPFSAMVLFVSLWFLRQKTGRGPLTAMLFFAGTLFPALGFFNVYPFRYSFVADHFQYLASIGLIVLVTSCLVIWSSKLKPVKKYIFFTVFILIIAILGVNSWRQGHIYKDLETLWRDTIAKNPQSWLANNNLGVVLMNRGDLTKGMGYFSRALKAKPDYAKSHYNLGTAFAHKGRLKEAIKHFREVVKIEPEAAAAHNNLGAALMQQGDFKDAIDHFSEALRTEPGMADAHYNMAKVLARQGHLKESIDHFSEALRIKPDFAEAHYSLGLVLLKGGKLEESAGHFTEALKIEPEHRKAHNDIGVALMRQGNIKDAIGHFSEALRIRPDFNAAQKNYRLCSRLIAESAASPPNIKNPTGK